MHRPRSEPVREVKLRAACDRCHDLKNRCVRIGGPDSRCDRCERLDIDCVYQNSSSMGRPKRQRKTPALQSQQPEQAMNRRMSNATSDKMPEVSVIDTDGPELSRIQMEEDAIPSGSTTLIDSPSDATSLLMSPKVGLQLTDPYWGLDFGHHINTIHDPLFQETHQAPHAVQQEDRPEHGVIYSQYPSGSVSNHKEPTATLTDGLFQLQGQLYRLLLAGDGQPGFDYVQEGLETAKSFLDMLQAGLAPKSSLPTEPIVFSPGRHTETSGPTPPQSSQSSGFMSENDPAMLMKDRHDAPSMGYITVQQALTCYLYVLLLLDRVVGVLTTRAGVGDVSVPGYQESPAALHLGVFSLASQPALNNEIVLHLILRIVQHLRAIIQMLASKCTDLVDDIDQTSTSAGSDRESSGKTTTSPISLAAIMYAMSDLVVKRERLLVERLTSLTSGSIS